MRPGQYLPYADWHFADQSVQTLAELAWEASKYIHVDQELEVLERLISGTERQEALCLNDLLKDLRPPKGAPAMDGPIRIEQHAALSLEESWPKPEEGLVKRLHELLGENLQVLGEGWRLDGLAGDLNTLVFKLGHPSEADFIAEIGKADTGPCFREVGGYSVRYRGASLSDGQRSALEWIIESLSN